MYTPLNSFIINVIMRWPALAVVIAAGGAAVHFYLKGRA
jgi:hypothetical protein